MKVYVVFSVPFPTDFEGELVGVYASTLKANFVALTVEGGHVVEVELNRDYKELEQESRQPAPSALEGVSPTRLDQSPEGWRSDGSLGPPNPPQE